MSDRGPTGAESRSCSGRKDGIPSLLPTFLSVVFHTNEQPRTQGRDPVLAPDVFVCSIQGPNPVLAQDPRAESGSCSGPKDGFASLGPDILSVVFHTNEQPPKTGYCPCSGLKDRIPSLLPTFLSVIFKGGTPLLLRTQEQVPVLAPDVFVCSIQGRNPALAPDPSAESRPCSGPKDRIPLFPSAESRPCSGPKDRIPLLLRTQARNPALGLDVVVCSIPYE